MDFILYKIGNVKNATKKGTLPEWLGIYLGKYEPGFTLFDRDSWVQVLPGLRVRKFEGIRASMCTWYDSGQMIAKVFEVCWGREAF